jgi:exopolyphosphatase/guanosine-5'-triphosphate,3'-diphosphate pyrophosphatase
MAFACVDIGTNSVLLLLVEQRGAALHPLLQRCEITRLGRGVDATGQLSPDGIENTVAALRSYRKDIADHGIDRVQAIGTSALRDAENAEDFVQPAQALLGCEVEIVDCLRQALPAGSALLDVGGGSTELIRIGQDGAIALRHSIDIGSVRLTERLIRHDPPSPQDINAIKETIAGELRRLPAGLREPATQLVGVAGTATTHLGYAILTHPILPLEGEHNNVARWTVV